MHVTVRENDQDFVVHYQHYTKNPCIGLGCLIDMDWAYQHNVKSTLFAQFYESRGIVYKVTNWKTKEEWIGTSLDSLNRKFRIKVFNALPINKLGYPSQTPNWVTEDIGKNIICDNYNLDDSILDQLDDVYKVTILDRISGMYSFQSTYAALAKIEQTECIELMLPSENKVANAHTYQSLIK